MSYYEYEYEDEGGIGVIYPITILVALGIYLVVARYQSIRNRAIPFRYPAPSAVGPDFQTTKIENPHLLSHQLDSSLLPPFHVPGREYITSFDPATGFHLGTFVADNAEEINQKITRAWEAQSSWEKTNFYDRRRVIRSLKKWLVDNQEAASRVAARDTGKTLLDAALGEVLVTCSKMDWILNHGERYLRPESRSTNWLLLYKKAEVHYDPLGVVAAVVSWNYPLHNLWSPILSAIFAGNGVVVKCSENVVWSSQWFIGAIKECLRTCGHNPELVQLVCCYPDQAEALTSSEGIRHITFIGSERVGRLVVQAAARHLTPVTLELGGKDPCIIMPSTDIKKIASIIMRGIFQNAGQNCIGIERVIVHESQYEEVYNMLLERTKELRPGSALTRPDEGFIPTVDIGAMISSERFPEIKRVLETAVNHGATLDYGGEPWKHPYLDQGAYFQPTVVGDVDPESEIAQTELFAPIALVMKYSNIEEAIAIANGTRYALGASVFGPDQEQCFSVATKLKCGMVSVNDFAVFYVNLPFGGTKMSGYGRFGGPEGLRALTSPKAIIVDRWPWLAQTTIPKVVDYPVPSVLQSWDFISGLIGFFYGDSWRQRITSLRRLMNANQR
ncbi:meiotic sister-chromatid recombination aldehyde dehydrogenase [Abortiporus biennis]|nr:meiotic sister-chromatid recombination aldehyde dehydrogenase [Abortiporus biennis]